MSLPVAISRHATLSMPRTSSSVSFPNSAASPVSAQSWRRPAGLMEPNASRQSSYSSGLYVDRTVSSMLVGPGGPAGPGGPTGPGGPAGPVDPARPRWSGRALMIRQGRVVRQVPMVRQTPVVRRALMIRQTLVVRQGPVVRQNPVVRWAPVVRQTPAAGRCMRRREPTPQAQGKSAPSWSLSLLSTPNVGPAACVNLILGNMAK